MAIKTVPSSPNQNLTKIGAQAFMALMQGVKDISDATCDSCDGRDYRSIATLIERSVRENTAPEIPANQREGYIRALTDLLTLNADGCALSEDWDPLKATRNAFSVKPSLRRV